MRWSTLRWTRDFFCIYSRQPCATELVWGTCMRLSSMPTPPSKACRGGCVPSGWKATCTPMRFGDVFEHVHLPYWQPSSILQKLDINEGSWPTCERKFSLFT